MEEEGEEANEDESQEESGDEGNEEEQQSEEEEQQLVDFEEQLGVGTTGAAATQSDAPLLLQGPEHSFTFAAGEVCFVKMMDQPEFENQ